MARCRGRRGRGRPELDRRPIFEIPTRYDVIRCAGANIVAQLPFFGQTNASVVLRYAAEA